MLKVKFKNKYFEAVSKGHTYIPNNYLFDNCLKDGEKTLLTLLQASCFGDKVKTYPAQKTLAVALNKSVRTIQRYIQRLKELGYIEVRRRGSISNMYTVLIKKAQKVGEQFVKNMKEKMNRKNNSTFSNYPQRNYSKQDLKSIEDVLTAWQLE